jgi:hypothetical protein
MTETRTDTLAGWVWALENLPSAYARQGFGHTATASQASSSYIAADMVVCTNHVQGMAFNLLVSSVFGLSLLKQRFKSYQNAPITQV